MRFVQVMAGVLALFAILNFLLMVFGIIKPLIFWINTGFLALLAFVLVPLLSKKLKE